MKKFKKVPIVIIFACLAVSSAAFASVELFKNLRGPKKEDNIKTVRNYMENEQYTDAMLELNKLLSSNPDDPRVYVLAAELLRKTGQLDEAEKMARDAHKLDYKNSRAYTELGYIYLEKGLTAEKKRENLVKAFDHFFMAAQYDPANPMPHIALAEAYHINMQKSRSKDEILKARELSHGNADAYYKIGRYYRKINEPDKAQKYIRKSVEAGRDSFFRTHYILGAILEQKGKIKEAQQQYLTALKLKPDMTEAQERLDALIRVSYRENRSEKNAPKDVYEEVGEDLRHLMKADYYLMLDQFTQARDIYAALLEKNPGNPGAIAGLAELYYLKWKGGYITSKNFTSDAIFIIKAETNEKNQIALLKFRMINEQKIPEEVREKLINLSITESFEFYDLLNELRAEFLLGNYEECHGKLLRLLEMKLSNYEKFKVLKHLTYDNNYYEALFMLKELEKTYYHNEEIEPVEKRIMAKHYTAGEKIEEALLLYKKKEYGATIPYYKEIINYFPTYKPAYLHYARAMDKLEDYGRAYDMINTYYRLYNLYPDKEPEISEREIKEMIQDLYEKMKEQAEQAGEEG